MLPSRIWTTFLSFASVGAVGTMAHFAVLLALVELAHFDAVTATAAGALCGAAVNYGLNYTHTFRSTASHADTLPRFFVVAVVGMALNAAVLKIMLAAGLPYLAGQVVATGVVLVFGFALSHLWTFRRTPVEQHRQSDDT